MTKQIDKPIFSSKINWLAFGLAVLGGLANPDVYKWFAANGITFSPMLVAVAIQVGAVLVYIVRTYYTVCSAPSLVDDPKMDSIPTDVVVQEIPNKVSGKIDP
jgi:hypothetical protein